MATLRDIALILLALEVAVLALFSLAALGGAVYGLSWLRRCSNLPRWLRVVRACAGLGQEYIELAMTLVVWPVFLVHQAAAFVRRCLQLSRR